MAYAEDRASGEGKCHCNVIIFVAGRLEGTTAQIDWCKRNALTDSHVW